MDIDHLMNARVVKDILRVATTNMKSEKMKLPLICVMMHMLKKAMKIRRTMNLQKMMERVKPLKVNLMKILEIYLKKIVG
ncbi:hypothetical protein KY289_016416 [Solanum tuberosum]|nr:hypothetical protein KY289_016416 [Solanum tuberosum]